MSAATNLDKSSITYAPYIEPVTGNYKLVCVALKWQDNPGPSLETVTTSGEATAATYKRLSNGQFTFEPVSYQISVPYDHTHANLLPAVASAKKQLEQQHGIPVNGKDITYVMVNDNVAPVSFTEEGGNTSNLLNTLQSTFDHEVGRTTPFVLGSSGAFKKGNYEEQADGTTFMGHFGSNKLTASQLYYLGWLPNTQVALYSDITATSEYTLAPLDADDTTGLKAVLIQGATSKPLFLSRPLFDDGSFSKHPKVLYALHLASGANDKGSERVTVFAKDTTYNNLSFQQQSITQDGSSAIISIAPQPKP